MYQYRRKTTELTTSFGKIVIGFISLALVGVLGLTASSAFAASYTSVKFQKNPRIVLKSNLAEIAGHNETRLDWARQATVLNFDLPRHNWYEKLDLFLSVYPEGKVAKGAPVEVSLNGGQPIALYGQGAAFEAHITLDTGRIQLQDNRLTIRYKTPAGKTCLSPAEGGWVVDMKRSRLVATTRPKKRAMQIVEVEQRLAHAMAAPKRVRIIATGDNHTELEALVAQAIAERMKFVPDFKLASGPADMKLLIGTSADLNRHIKNKAMLHKNAPIAFMDSGLTPTLVLTAPDEAGVLRLARAFALYHLPSVRRNAISIGEFYTAPRLEPVKLVENGTYALSSLGNPVLETSWRPEPVDIRFNAKTDETTRGVLTLKILSAKDINPASRVRVSLNGRSLGYTNLDKSTKNVEFAIRPGLLKASDNHLSIKPSLIPGAEGMSCAARQYIPTVLVSGKSRLKLESPAVTPKADLAGLASGGAPFDRNTTIVLTGRSLVERQAALKFLATAAQKFGPRWVSADYVRALPRGAALDSNLLIVGPKALPDAALLKTAPRAFRLAVGRKAAAPGQASGVQTFGQYASNNEAQVVKMAAAQVRARRMGRGGIATVFPSPYAKGRMVGIISADKPSDFTAAMQALAAKGFWNGLKGIVVRWNRHTIMMAQTALPLAGEYSSSAKAPRKTNGLLVVLSRGWANIWAPRESARSVASAVQQNGAKYQAGAGKSASLLPIGRMEAQNAALYLRGALPTPVATLYKRQAGFRIKGPEWQMPGLTGLRVKAQRQIKAVRVWSGRKFGAVWNAPRTYKWRKAFVHNPALFFGTLVFLAFFLIALTSPMRSRVKIKKKRAGGRYF